MRISNQFLTNCFYDFLTRTFYVSDFFVYKLREIKTSSEIFEKSSALNTPPGITLSLSQNIKSDTFLQTPPLPRKVSTPQENVRRLSWRFRRLIFDAFLRRNVKKLFQKCLDAPMGAKFKMTLGDMNQTTELFGATPWKTAKISRSERAKNLYLLRRR